MPWRVAVDGRTYRSDDLTVAQAEQLELAGVRLSEAHATVRGVHAVVTALVGRDAADGLLLADVEIVEDDLPDQYTDGLPDEGGRWTDRHLVIFARPPFCWPPDVVRRQTLRDLRLLSEALGGDT